MSFISILKQIGGTLVGVEHVLSKTGIINLIPGGAAIDAIFQVIPDSTAKAEALNPLDKQGALKLPIVQADFEAGLTVTREILAAAGMTLTYDAGALKEAIEAQVSAYNAMAKVKASFKVASKNS